MAGDVQWYAYHITHGRTTDKQGPNYHSTLSICPKHMISIIQPLAAKRITHISCPGVHAPQNDGAGAGAATGAGVGSGAGAATTNAESARTTRVVVCMIAEYGCGWCGQPCITGPLYSAGGLPCSGGALYLGDGGAPLTQGLDVGRHV
jgi:hypothetical protein